MLCRASLPLTPVHMIRLRQKHFVPPDPAPARYQLDSLSVPPQAAAAPQTHVHCLCRRKACYTALWASARQIGRHFYAALPDLSRLVSGPALRSRVLCGEGGGAGVEQSSPRRVQGRGNMLIKAAPTGQTRGRGGGEKTYSMIGSGWLTMALYSPGSVCGTCTPRSVVYREKRLCCGC